MLAYKFRSPSQIEFALDILFNDRLYCADWSTLNDPMEGEFFYSHKSTDETDYSTKLDQIRIEKKKYIFAHYLKLMIHICFGLIMRMAFLVWRSK